MSNPKCAVCGQVNRVGAEICSVCDSRLGDAAANGAADAGPSYAGGEGPREGALPTDIPLPQFKSVSDVASPTLDVYKKSFPLIGLLVLTTTLPLAALQYASYLLMTSRMSEDVDGAIGTDAGGFLGMFATSLWVGGALAWLLTMLGNSLLAGALAYAVVELQRTGSAKAGACLHWGLRKMPKIVAVNLLSALIIYGVGWVLLAASFLLLGPIAVIVLILLIVPWVLFTLMFSLVVPAAAIENCGVIESFTRSAELTRGQKGLIFMTYFLWGLLMLVVQFIVSGSFAFGGTEQSAVAMLLQTFIGQMLQSTTLVLTIYIFLGILSEGRHGFDNRAVTPAADATR